MNKKNYSIARICLSPVPLLISADEMLPEVNVTDKALFKKRAQTVKDMLGWVPGVFAQPRYGDVNAI